MRVCRTKLTHNHNNRKEGLLERNTFCNSSMVKLRMLQSQLHPNKRNHVADLHFPDNSSSRLSRRAYSCRSKDRWAANRSSRHNSNKHTNSACNNNSSINKTRRASKLRMRVPSYSKAAFRSTQSTTLRLMVLVMTQLWSNGKPC